MSRGNASAPDGAMNAFRQGMRELGYTEGQGFVIEPRYADGKAEVMPAPMAHPRPAHRKGGPSALSQRRGGSSARDWILAQAKALLHDPDQRARHCWGLRRRQERSVLVRPNQLFAALWCPRSAASSVLCSQRAGIAVAQGGQRRDHRPETAGIWRMPIKPIEFPIRPPRGGSSD
jgi:hypothetical protein